MLDPYTLWQEHIPDTYDGAFLSQRANEIHNPYSDRQPMQTQIQTEDPRIMHRFGWGILVWIIALVPAVGCTQNMGTGIMHKHIEETITYGAGRFVIDIPAGMQFSGGYGVQGVETIEVLWPEQESDKNALAAWKSHMESITQIEPPKGKSSVIIEEKEIPGIGMWCKSVFLHHARLDPTRAAMDFLINYGVTGLWLKDRDLRVDAKDICYEVFTDLARAYRPPAERFGQVSVVPGKDAFYLRYGAIDLPFEYKESVDIVFSGHVLDGGLKLGVMTRVVREDQKIGLLDKAANAIASKLAKDLVIKKIRTGPLVIINMDSQDGQLEEKMALWDAILASMRPAGR